MILSNNIFKNDGSCYIAMYGWQDNFGDDMTIFGYINSYKEAADDLVEMKHPDLYIFPIVFSYRQYIELLLKNIYIKNEVSNKDDYKKFISKISHRLDKLWITVKPIIEKEHSNDDVNYIGELVDIIHNLDPKSD